MTFIEGSSIGRRLGDAVHRSTALSLDGILERIFSNAFRGLVYAQIWEDPVVDMEALGIKPHHELVCIASGSCNVMSYLTANPKSITAVDLSPAHVALGRLKIAAAKHLPSHACFRTMFAGGSNEGICEVFDTYLTPYLDDDTLRWWTGRMATGRRRITMLNNGFYKRGLLGRFIGLGHILAKLHGANPAGILRCSSVEAQTVWFERNIAPLFDKPFIRLLASRRASLFGLGIPPAQYEALAGPDGDMAAVLKERMRRLVCRFPLKDNYFAWQAFARRYGEPPEAPLPPYLEEANFETMRANSGRISVLNENMTHHLATLPAGSRHGFVLLDAQDWMTDEQLNALWTQITRVAAPGARVIFRTAANERLLPSRVDDRLLENWNYLAGRSAELHGKDRSAVYGGFHIYEKNT